MCHKISQQFFFRLGPREKQIEFSGSNQLDNWLAPHIIEWIYFRSLSYKYKLFSTTAFIHILTGKRLKKKKITCFPICAHLGKNYHGKHLGRWAVLLLLFWWKTLFIHNNLMKRQACNNTFNLQHFLIEWNTAGGLVCLQWSAALCY